MLWRGVSEAAGMVCAAGTEKAERKGSSVHKQRLREPTATHAEP